MQITTIDSPIGPLTVAAHQGSVVLLHFGAEDERVRRQLRRSHSGESVEPAPDPAGAVSVLQEYFSGRHHALDRVPVVLHGTAFQQRVWSALRAIPPGTTMSYAALAHRIGMPAAVRAVGAANGANPVALIVPCHRVIGADGSLTGYGGGLERKRWLLEHEGAIAGRTAPLF